jgi:hypothetical protein
LRRSICSSSEEEEEVSGVALLVEEGAAVVEVAGTKAREGSVAEDWEEEARDGSPSMEDDIVEVLDGYLWRMKGKAAATFLCQSAQIQSC